MEIKIKTKLKKGTLRFLFRNLNYKVERKVKTT